MKIGIDISQLAYGTGVGNYLQHLVEKLVEEDTKNTYVLFFSAFRGKLSPSFLEHIRLQKNVSVKRYPFPPKLLDLIWNVLHTFPIELFLGPLDMYISSDWTEPPVRKTKKATILYDLIVYKYPQETAKIIEETQKRKLRWVKKETDIIFCISQATKKDAEEILGIDNKKLHVIYPGMTL